MSKCFWERFYSPVYLSLRMETSPGVLEYSVSPALLALFHQQATQKIQSEGWAKQGRNVDVKIQNFVRCWTTEEAFKQILMQCGIWFRYRGLYFGDAKGAGADFTVRIERKEVTIGLRSVLLDSIQKWNSIPYPDDRFRDEKETIAEYHVLCSEEQGRVIFIGMISKEELLSALQASERKYSAKNQEYFRTIPLEQFTLSELISLIARMERV